MTENLTERKQEKNARAQFVLMGFSQTAAIRVYAFEGLNDGRRTDYTVQVDLALLPGYGIQIQDLPLLCRELLQERAEAEEMGALAFTEPEMRALAEKRAIAREEAQRKRPARHPASTNPGSGWRTPFL